MYPDVTDREGLDRLEVLVSQWLALPEVADLLGTGITRVRRMIDDKVVLAVRRGEPRVLSVPRELVDPEPVPELPGTVSVLADGGYSLVEALSWLLTEDPTLPGTPLANLRAGRKTEVRRRAQALAF